MRYHDRRRGTLLTCTQSNGSYAATIIISKVDGNPLFFPVDGDTFTPASEFQPATIHPTTMLRQPGPMTWMPNGNKRLHNFSFTSEVRYWFLYDKTKTYTLTSLATTMCGVHQPKTRRRSWRRSYSSGWQHRHRRQRKWDHDNHPDISPSSACRDSTVCTLGLQNGQVYEIAVFQTERQTSGSSYKLTLNGFSAAPSDCTPKCGTA